MGAKNKILLKGGGNNAMLRNLQKIGCNLRKTQMSSAKNRGVRTG